MAQKMTDNGKLVQTQLSKLIGVFAKTAIGVFPKKVDIPEEETEITPLFIGVQLLLDTVRDHMQALEKANAQLQRKIREVEVERRRAAALLSKVKADREKIRQEKTRSDAVVKSIGEGVITTDNKGRISFISQSAKSILKISDQSFRYRTPDELWMLYRMDGRKLKSARRPITWVLKNRRKISGRYVVLTKSGDKIPVAITASPIMVSGKMHGTVQVVRDISRDIELERLKDENIAITSHELRTPLTAIRGFVTMANAGKLGPFPERFKTPLNHITAATDRLIRLVNNLLDIQSIESGLISFKNEPFSLRDAIAKVTGSMIVLIREKNLRLATGEIPAIEIIGDQDRFIQILQNLVSNAVKYSRRGTISISCECTENAITCKVTDTGLGVPLRKQHLLFKKFGRVAHDETGTGNGLGLYISRLFARKMGGDVWLVNSKKGKGSTFAFSLPLKPYVSRMVQISKDDMNGPNKIRLVVFDLNGTLIRENSWHELNLTLGITEEEDARLLKRHAAGEITYLEGQKELEYLYKLRGKAVRARIEQVLYSYTFVPHAVDTVKYLQEKGYQLAIVSGSLDLLVRRVALKLGIGLFAANNSMLFDAEGRLMMLKVAGEDGPFKTATAKKYAGRLGIPVSACAAVGDSGNDRGIFELTGHGITFKGSPLEDVAWKVIGNLSDLR